MINKINSFKGNIYSNKTALKVLKYASDNPALLEKGATLALSTVVRPLSVLLTPKTDKKEKQYIFAKSLASGVVSFALTSAIFRPISRSMDLISKEPQKYLKQATIDTLKTAGKALDESKPYVFLKQNIKYMPAYAVILPKALLTTALIAPIIELAFNKKEKKKELYAPKSTKLKQQSFKGETLARLIAKPLNNKSVQNFALKHQNSNLFMNIISMKDVIATSVFALVTRRNKHIEEKNKKPLIINAFLSTGLTVAAGFAADRATKKPMEKFLSKLEKANKGDKNLHKYIEGAKVLKPIIILGTLYYAVIPVVSTFLSGKIAHKNDEIKAEKK